MSLILDRNEIRRALGSGWQRPIPLPEHAHPLVREFVRIANREETTMREIAAKAGLSPHTLSSWRGRHMPLLDAFDAAVNVLDYRLCLKKRRYGE